ncbi:hypothetical protein ACHAW6_002697, partial [Cyclotella cf. meneghiniana]
MSPSKKRLRSLQNNYEFTNWSTKQRIIRSMTTAGMEVCRLSPPPNTAMKGRKEQRRQLPDCVHRSGLGELCVLNDEQLLEILSFVDGPSLAGGIILCLMFLYVAGHHEELWRDLVLRTWGEMGFDVCDPSEAHDADSCESPEKSHPSKNTGCWKDIYALNFCKMRQTSNQDYPKKHKPIPMQGIYSDTFFRSWLCRSFALQPSWLSIHTVSTIHHSDLTAEIFLKEYEETNTPLLIKGASSSWPALRKWNADYFIEITKGKSFRATSGAALLPAQFTMQNYFCYCNLATEEVPFALDCWRILRRFSRRVVVFGIAIQSLDKVCWVFWGRRGGWIINGLLLGRRGRKRWIFYPPGVIPPGVFPSPCGDDVCMPISLDEWFLTFWDAHVEHQMDPNPRRRPLECTACPRDVLFVPHGWWHLMLNIRDTNADSFDGGGMSVALMRNYVSASNLLEVLRFLDTRVGQISGCRDR